MITFRMTRGHGAADRTITADELSLSLFGHCEEVDVQPDADSERLVEVESVRPFGLTLRTKGERRRVAGRSAARPVFELIWIAKKNPQKAAISVPI